MGSGLMSSIPTVIKQQSESIEPTAGKAFQSSRFSVDKPLYVPSQRALEKKTDGYQPTIMQRQTIQNNTTTSFTTNPSMGSTTSTVGTLPIAPSAKQE